MAAPIVSKEDVRRVATALHDARPRVSILDFKSMMDAVGLMDQMQRRLDEVTVRPAWIEAAASECASRVLVGAGEATFAEIIKRHAGLE